MHVKYCIPVAVKMKIKISEHTYCTKATLYYFRLCHMSRDTKNILIMLLVVLFCTIFLFFRRPAWLLKIGRSLPTRQIKVKYVTVLNLRSLMLAAYLLSRIDVCENFITSYYSFTCY